MSKIKVRTMRTKASSFDVLLMANSNDIDSESDSDIEIKPAPVIPPKKLKQKEDDFFSLANDNDSTDEDMPVKRMKLDPDPKPKYEREPSSDSSDSSDSSVTYEPSKASAPAKPGSSQTTPVQQEHTPPPPPVQQNAYEYIDLTEDADELPQPRSTRSSQRQTKSPQKQIKSPQKQSSPRLLRSKPVVEEEEDEDDYASIMASVKQLRSQSVEAYQFTDSEETNRPYLLNIIPKFPDGTPNSFSTKGTKTFDNIIQNIIQHYKKLKQLPQNTQAANFTLFWIAARIEIKPFFKPSTLRIPKPNSKDLVYVKNVGYTSIDCLLIPKQMAAKALETYDELKTKYEKFLALAGELEEINDYVTEIEITGDEEIDTEARFEKPEIDVDAHFTIFLKGKDNKRVPVKVNGDTKIEKLLKYYIEQQGKKYEEIDLKKVKMLFDDEPLDLNDIVGNTELEEEYEIQVYL